MDSLEYSSEALEVKAKFYNKDFTVFVEGIDDVLFWQNIFERTNKDPHIEDVGGVKELDKIIDKIINEGANLYVASDNDYSDFKDHVKIHQNIIRTFGYSIENSIYTIDLIENSIKNFSKKKVDLKKDIEKSISDFMNKIEEILIYEITNERFGKGVSVLGNNSLKFLKSNNSIECCDNKIKIFVEKIKDKFKEVEINEVKELLEKSEKEFWFIIRGHFLTNFVINLIKHFVKKICSVQISMSLDMLYALAIDFRNLDQTIDVIYIEDQINKLSYA
jgi:succinate dehydrogenase flavin-adding protein (antitoxin of CptAB toxin-antitoxin module)